MSELARIGIAIPEELLEEFDRLIERRGYATRSEAVRDLVRKELVDEIATSPTAEVYGAVTLIYDHHARLLLDKLTDLQHQHHEAIMSSVHVHLDHDNCLEVILVRGKSASVRKLADSLIAMKGVKHGRFMLTTSGHDQSCVQFYPTLIETARRMGTFREQAAAVHRASLRSYIFHGKVESLNAAEASLRVNGDKVEGWMDAMTMNYKVDDPAVFDKVKPGDSITATVYDEDMVLHKVRVVANDSKAK